MGKKFFRLGFGDAVAKGILTDYKVEVLAVDESVIQRDMQNSLSTENGLNIDDIGKIIGVWNAMMKRKVFLIRSLVPLCNVLLLLLL
jgi:predicted helicase